MAAGLPPRGGAGFKPQHAAAIRADPGPVAWFEVHAENCMGAGGLPHRLLDEIRARFPLSVHGVGLSIGGEGPIDRAHLARVRAVVQRWEPESFSEHLAWSSHDGAYLGDLLPLPLNAATLARVADHVDEVQAALGRRILVENPTSYLRLPGTEMEETDFLAALAARTGCGLLLDVNNLAISAANLGLSAAAWIDRFPLDLVGEIHVAGHAEERDSLGPLRIDTHDRPVAADVWALLARAVARGGPRPVLVEWDEDVPDWPALAAEVARAGAVLAGAGLADAG